MRIKICCYSRPLSYTERDDNSYKEPQKDIHIAHLDVTKAYEKAWVDVIMYVMYK